MYIRIIKVINNDGSIELFFKNLGHWDYLELIKNLLVNENQCFVINELDMITDKDILLDYQGFHFLLRHHYMLGNYLQTTETNQIIILEQLANNVANSINEYIKKQRN